MNWLINSDRSKYTRQMGRFLQEGRKEYVWIGSVRFILLLLALATPLLYKLLVDKVLISGELQLLWIVITGYLLSYVFETLLLATAAKRSNRLSNLLAIRLRKMMWSNFSRFYYERFSLMGPGELKNRIDNDVEALTTFPDKQVIQYFYNVTLLAALSIVMLVVNWQLALLGFLSIPLSFWMTKWLGKSVYRTSESFRNQYAKYEGWLKETLQEWKEIKSFSLEKKKEVQFTTHWNHLSRMFFIRQMYTTTNRTFITFKDFFVTKLNMYFVGGLFILDGHLSIGSLILFMSYYDLAFKSLGILNDLDIQLQGQKPSLTRVIDTLHVVEETNISARDAVRFNGSVQFENVSFSFPGNKQVLKDFNLRIDPGEAISIVGRSGSGKSTVAKLLSGMLQPEAGAVRINDTDNVNDIVPEVINRNIGIVMQDSVLFNLSIRENLLLANPKAAQDEIEWACKIAQLDTWIKGLPDGYETVLGERGVSLSGGQRQRMAVARVLLQKPKILVFDEATSQLDHEAEHNLLCSVRENLRGTTLLMITHRLQSVLLSDRTVLLDEGELAASGTHDELVATNRTYRKMFLQQKLMGGEGKTDVYNNQSIG